MDDNTIIPVISSDRIEKGKEKALRFIVGKKVKGEGKRTFPVLYLGLRRLFPLAQEDSINHGILSDLTQEEVVQYQELHNSILLLNETINPELVDTVNKRFYAARTSKYDSLGNSAGQDNVGQIISAILSFRRLQRKLGNNYQGGILLIDEIDATLFAGAQEKLIAKLFRLAQDLKLQIVFTTHSIEILQLLKLPKYKADSEIVFLDNTSGVVRNNQGNDVTIEKMINNIMVMYEQQSSHKIHIFCEDYEASIWIKNMLGSKITKHLHVLSDSFSGSNLVNIANKKIPLLNKCVFVLDGDQQGSMRNNRCPRVVLLPGNERPENIFYNYLRALPADDTFWGGFGMYNQQLCFRDLPVISTEREVMKRWFRDQEKYWGRGASRLFNKWKRVNESTVTKFVGLIKAALHRCGKEL